MLEELLREELPLIAVQTFGAPYATYVAWFSDEAGEDPPSEDWRGKTLESAVFAALRDRGIKSAHVVEIPHVSDDGDQDREDYLGVISLPD